MIISRYKKDDIIKAVDSYVQGLTRGQTNLTLKRFGMIGDIIEYAIFKVLESLTSAGDNITIIESRTAQTPVQRELDYFLEEPEVMKQAQPIAVSSVTEAKLLEL